MSKIALYSDENGTGTFTIASPNSNTNRTLTLPDATGSVVLQDNSGTINANNLTLASVPVFAGDPENCIINGAFDFWQRGTSSTGSGYVAADRWFNNGVGGTVTQSRQSFAVGDTLGQNSPAFFLRQTVSGQTLSSHRAQILQPIEGVRSYAGHTITILGWARRSSGSGNMSIELDQFFGSGGSPSTAVNSIGVTTVSLTTSFEPFAVTVAVPSITGKTLGTNNNDYLRLGFWTSAGSDFNARTNSLGLQTIGVDLWGIHIKRGTHTVAAVDGYRAPELGPELIRCQRYYQKYTQPALRGVASSASVVNRAGMQLPVVMRKTPAATVGALPVYDGVNVSVVSSLTANHCTDRVAEFGFNVSPANLGIYRPVIVYQDGTAALELDAEL